MCKTWRIGGDCDNQSTNAKSEVHVMSQHQLPDFTQMVEHPPHYTAGKVECIDAIESAVEGLTPQEAIQVGNIMKYIWRFKRKNGKQDLHKAAWYLARLTEMQDE